MEELGSTVLVSFLLIYFIPSMVAIVRGGSKVKAILLLNLFLAWTFIGWFVCLGLACAKNIEVEN